MMSEEVIMWSNLICACQCYHQGFSRGGVTGGLAGQTIYGEDQVKRLLPDIVDILYPRTL